MYISSKVSVSEVLSDKELFSSRVKNCQILKKMLRYLYFTNTLFPILEYCSYLKKTNNKISDFEIEID